MKNNPLERVMVYESQPLKKDGLTILKEFPIGEGYFWIELNFELVLVNTTGTTLISGGELGIIRKIKLIADGDNVIYDAGGWAATIASNYVMRRLSLRDTMAAGSATYRVSIPLFFYMDFLRRPQDLMLDTSRYRKLELHIEMGNVSDLFASVGDAVVTPALTVNVVKTKNKLAGVDAPIAVPYVVQMPSVDPASFQYLDFERNSDLAIMAFVVTTMNAATLGIPYRGTVADTTISRFTFQDNKATPFKLQEAYSFKEYARIIMNSSFPFSVGMYLFDFLLDKSIYSSYDTGNKTLCRLSWENATLSTSQVNTVMMGWKKIKAGK